MVRRPRAGIRALGADRQTPVVHGAAALLANKLVPAAAVLVETDGREVLGRTRLQNAAGAEVVAELPCQHACHVPAREVRVGRQLRRPLEEARPAGVTLDALPSVGRMAGFEAARVRLRGAAAKNRLDRKLLFGRRHVAEQDQVVRW